MKNKLMIVVLVMICVLSSGCGKTIIRAFQSTEKVEVSSVSYRGPYVTISHVGSCSVPINHPSRYSTTILYDGIKYTTNNTDIYNVCKDKEGKTVDALIEHRLYSNGTASFNIESIIIDNNAYNW